MGILFKFPVFEGQVRNHANQAERASVTVAKPLVEAAQKRRLTMNDLKSVCSHRPEPPLPPAA